MTNIIKNVCVLGAGVMGCNIAAHLANAGLNVLLLDQPNNGEDKNTNIKANLDLFSKMKPNIFFAKNLKNRVRVGNFEENLSDIVDYDWVIEAIIENLEIKNKMFQRIDNILKESGNNVIVTSNTSGLSVKGMCEGTSLEFRQNFLVTHFFNPVRYLHLLEIVPSNDTKPENVVLLSDFCNRVLGKGVIHAKESPNFIANRIGIYASLKSIQLMSKNNFSVEDIDYILGEQTGRPKSAVFKTLDIVGLDTFAHVTQNCFDSLPHDEEHSVFENPNFIMQMIEKNLLGRKTKQGFYKKEKKSLFVLNVNSMEYEAKKKVKFQSIEGAKKKSLLSEKMKFILDHSDEASSFVRDITVFVCIYAANRVFEISDNIEDIDNSMKWGFNWSSGPFEICDIIGVKKFIELSNEKGCNVPEWLSHELLLEKNSFYIYEDNLKKVWMPKTNTYEPVKDCKNNTLNFQILKNSAGNIVKKLNVTNLVDLGDRVLACEFNTKLNSVDFDILSDIEKSLDFCEKENYKGMVLYNEGGHFSVGMNLWLVYMGMQQKQWKQIEEISKKFQDLCVRLKYSPTVTVAAPYNLTLGGGAELSMWCNRIEAHAELYMGLVEVGVGLIPGAGGNIEMIDRALLNIPNDKKIPLDIVLSKALESIALAKVGTSATESRQLLYLSPQDGITMNKDLHLQTAKFSALSMISAGNNNSVRREFNLPGREAYSNFKLMLSGMYEGGFMSEHDLKISLKIANLISGGDCNPNHPVTEQYLLDLERETFLSLCGEKKTYDRLEHMLKTNKPLRN
jgi:3-hydroxyacyl-CoA dehydrogenase